MLVEKEKLLKVDSEMCCAPFKPELWDNIKKVWNEKVFLKDSVPEIFHIPLPGTYERAITRMWRKAEGVGAAPEAKDFLLLAHDPSPFKGELYMAITKDIPGAQTEKLKGEFFSKVFEGSYGDIRKFLSATHQLLAANHLKPVKDYVYFPYCPKCAKKYGHNFVVILCQVVAENSAG